MSIALGDIVNVFLKDVEGGGFKQAAAQVVKVYEDAHGIIVHDVKLLVADIAGLVHKDNAADPSATKPGPDGNPVPDTSPAVSHVTETEPAASSTAQPSAATTPSAPPAPSQPSVPASAPSTAAGSSS